MMPENSLFAQFFSTYQPNQIQWPSGGLARYQALQAPSVSKSVQIVSMLDVRNVQSNSIVSFQMPGATDIWQAEATLITDDPDMGFIWSGKLLQAPGGYVSFIYRAGQEAGFIQIGKDFYEISPIDNNYQFLVKRNNDDAFAQNCGVADGPTEPPPPGPYDCDYLPNYNTCPALITVLLILTPEAKLMVENMYGSVDLFALLGQASVNSAFWNSDIPNKEIRVKWVVKEGFGFALNNNFNADLTTLSLFAEPERTQNKADLVVFVPHIDYPSIGGIANIPDAPDPNEAFSIVEANGFISKFVFAHELAHNLGCRHNWPVDLGSDLVKVCAKGKRWLPINTLSPPLLQELDSWRTIMASPVPTDAIWQYELDGVQYLIQIVNDFPILHYSNPSIDYFGEPTGRDTGKVADNANRIRSVGCDVNNYNTATELSVIISASPCTIPITLTANITPPEPGLPGLGPYTVYWFWNTSGIFPPGLPSQFLGTGATLSLSTHPDCPVFWVKCVVVSADNVTISRIKKVTVSGCDCLSDHRPSRSRGTDWAFSSNHTMRLYPNPVVGDMLFAQNEAWTIKGKIPYSLVDIWGRVVATGTAEPLAETALGIPLGEMSDGLYLLNLQMPDGARATHKFIKAKSN